MKHRCFELLCQSLTFHVSFSRSLTAAQDTREVNLKVEGRPTSETTHVEVGHLAVAWTHDI